MSPQDPAAKKPDGVNYQKPRTNVYTMMLILSLMAIVTAVVVLYMHLQTYGDWPQWKVDPRLRSAPAVRAVSAPDYALAQAALGRPARDGIPRA